MTQKELLKKSIKVDRLKGIENLVGIFIIQQRKLHDSGYRMMYVIGHKKDFKKYYLIATYSDVVIFENLYKEDKTIKDIHLDISANGIIHIWSNRNTFKCEWIDVSTCNLEVE